MNRTALVFLALALSGCQTAAAPGRADAPDFLPPPGTRLILKRPLVIPAGHASTYLQFGQALRYAEVNTYHPHCRFEVQKVGDTPQTIQPDEFRVTRASHEYRSTVRIGEPIRLAAAGGRVILGGKEDSGANPVAYVTLMKLRSDRQPEVLSLACGHWSYPPRDRHLSLAEMRSALGAIFSLDPGATGR